MLAARMEYGHDHQIGVAEDQSLGSGGGFGDTSQRSEMLVPGQASQVFWSDAGKTCDLFLGENLLARLDPDHRRGLRFLRCFKQINCCRSS
jgi:hypothetical protein